MKVEEELENSSPEEQIAILSEELPENVLEEYDDSPQKQKIELRRIDDDSQPPLPPPHEKDDLFGFNEQQPNHLNEFFYQAYNYEWYLFIINQISLSYMCFF